VHILGVAYKRDIDDVRESPALDIIALLTRRGAIVSYSDSYVPKIRIDGGELRAEDLYPSTETADCCVIITDHKSVDYDLVLERSKLLVDTRNALKGRKSEKLIRL
jgi:UDP-N-acetyl-D-glucosamine dehydrogenase